MTEAAEGRPVADRIVHTAARDVREAALDQRARRGHDVRNEVARAREVVRGADIEALHVINDVGGPTIAHGTPVLADLARFAQDVVIDVGDVLDVAYRDARALEIPDEHVSGRIGERVAQMRGVVGSDATDVEAHRVVGGVERLQGGRLRIVEFHVRRIIWFTSGIALFPFSTFLIASMGSLLLGQSTAVSTLPSRARLNVGLPRLPFLTETDTHRGALTSCSLSEADAHCLPASCN